MFSYVSVFFWRLLQQKPPKNRQVLLLHAGADGKWKPVGEAGWRDDASIISSPHRNHDFHRDFIWDIHREKKEDEQL